VDSNHSSFPRVTPPQRANPTETPEQRARGDQTEREEVITRRVLWALRGSNEDPPHPDRLSPARPAAREVGE
jgi:hypothetical protein